MHVCILNFTQVPRIMSSQCNHSHSYLIQCRLDLANAQLILKFPLTHSWITLNVQVTSTALNMLRTQSPTFKLWYQELWKYKRTGTDKNASVGSLIKYYQASSEALGLNDSSQTKIAKHTILLVTLASPIYMSAQNLQVIY